MANPLLYDDDFDFGGDDGDEAVQTGQKRTFLELEDDDEDEDVDIYPSKKMYGGTPMGADHATTTILNLRASLEEQDSTIAKLQNELNTKKGSLEHWRDTFQVESVLPMITNPEPGVILEAFQKLQASEVQLKEQFHSAKRRETAMLALVGLKEQEIADLKTLVHDLRLSLKPPIVQARRLLLDPPVHAQFTKMKKEIEATEKRVKELQDELATVQFTPHSKNGKMLMAKCRTLQEENEEIGREASEGKMHELGTNLAVQKSLNMELRRGYQELFEYVEDLNYEAERLQQTLYHLQREFQQKDHQTKQKDLQLAEYHKQSEGQDAGMKSREERGQQVEGKKDGYRGDHDSREKVTGESIQR